MKMTKRILVAVLSLCVFLGLIAGAVACGGDPEPDPQPIDYIITVTCEDADVLAAVQVQLTRQASRTEPTSLNAEHKAVFNLTPATYTVVVLHADGYAYPQTTVTAEQPTATVVLTAVENNDPETYAVTYALGSCEDTAYAGDSTLPTEGAKEEGAKFNLAAAPVWDGYSFEGWSDGENVYEAGAEYTMPAHAVTLTAQWEEIIAYYTVTYALGSCGDTAYAGDSALPTEADKVEGATFNLAAAPVWNGYLFNGWSDGENTYAAGTEYTMPAHAVTLTAQWKELYSVTYALGSCGDTAYAGDSTLPTEADKAEGAAFSLAAAPVWDGYSFDGWSDGESVYESGEEYTMPAHAVTLTAQWEEAYSVTYVFGSFGSTDYAGNSVLPTEADKAEGATFDLASAPVWDGYSFNGWNDGENIYEAGEEYTMPAHAVTLTAQWYNCPEGYLRSNVEVPTWNQNATTGYTIEKGQYLQLSASFSGKSLEGSEWAGIASKIYRNCDYSVVGTFYQFRPDFAVDRRDWGNWVQDNRDFYVTDTNWDESKYISLVYEADVLITVELSEQGVLTYTIELTSVDYSYKRVFSPKNATMNSALVFFGADGCTASNATLVSPMPNGVKLLFDWGYDNMVDLKVAEENSTYTFEADAVRDGYLFLGWQVNGAGEYYKSGDTYSAGSKQVRFIAAWEEDAFTEGLAFTELANGTYSVKKGTANAETVIIPRTYHNKPVTEIGSNAFLSAKWLEHIEIPDTVTTIGSGAFEGATLLKHIVLPDTVTTINGRAFHSSGLEEIVIPDGVKIIAVSTFYNCVSLTSVTLPSGLEDVQTDAFAKCTALQFNEAGNAMYLGNDENPYIVLIKAKDTSITECNIQSGCMMIYYQAFNKCTQLNAVTFPASLKIIGGQAFNGCKSLTTVVIPSTVESIGGQAFGGCSGLTSITVPFIGGGKQAGSNIYAFGYIFGTSSYTGGIRTSQPAPSGSTSFYYIPENLETVTVTGGSIPNGAFKNCSMITTIKLSADIKAIPANAFDACYGLTDVYFDGTETDWQKVSVSSTGNDPFKKATVHYKEEN